MCIRDSFHVNAAQALRTVQSMLESMYVVAHAAGLALQFDIIQKELLDDIVKEQSDPSRLATSDKVDKASLRKGAVSYTHLRAHETPEHLVCRLLLEKKKKSIKRIHNNTGIK
eukprot:TRINITY_DN22665_c0_g1_i1.p1 TRINITY_DN22665_c0_g1~~TRINITY_DN22665_c0_g1_i1.p1  ORF type:complete len:113 (+),score=33.52 TRINITY_DN22665_c0_g1_i1:127-465(+)